MFQQFFANTSLDDVYFGNSLFDYTLTLIIFFVALLVLELIRTFLSNHYRSSEGDQKPKVYGVLEKITASIHSPFIIFLALYIASQKITLPANIGKTIAALFVAGVIHQFIIATEAFVDYQIAKRSENFKEKAEAKRARTIAHLIIRAIFIIIGFLTILSIFDINITSILAGLGVSSVFIAFAAQNILGDLFSSLSIFLDKPFIVGDTITVGTNTGTVEEIGMKTTRLRSVQGEELIISNKELTSARIQNFGKMTKRRVVFVFKISQETNSKKVRGIPEQIKEIIEKEPRVRFDRSHFKDFSDNSFSFETVYFIIPPDYSLFMDIQQNINFEILAMLEQEKIKLAGANAG